MSNITSITFVTLTKRQAKDLIKSLECLLELEFTESNPVEVNISKPNENQVILQLTTNTPVHTRRIKDEQRNSD